VNLAQPLVTVIIPVYNGERYLREAIDSAINQTWRPLEIIVVDDGSTDSSTSIVHTYSEPVRCISQQHEGCQSALNRGVTSAVGEVFAFLDADDLWVPNKLQVQMSAHQEYPEMDMIFGHVRQFFTPDLDEDSRKRLLIPTEMLPGYCAGAMLITRNSFFKAGLFDSPTERGPFISWYAKAQQNGLTGIMLPDIVLLRRIHNANMGLMGAGSKKDFTHILKDVLDRRRKNS
jgi:glycosyltransferase involved in cell wall biosynthesis